MGNKKVLLLASIGLYLLSTGVSYLLFAKTNASNSPTPVQTSKKTNDFGALEFDSGQPKTEECPLNGAMYSKQQRQWWEGHRPLGVMIENSTDARPQSGMTFADVVYEAVAEGGITRFLNVFYCQDAGIVGPVRSARTYFLDFISEYGANPLYAHVGGANTPGLANALGQIDDYGWGSYNDLNQFSIGFPTFKRDESRLGHPVATEHTMYSSTSSLWAVGKQRGLTNVDKQGDKWDEDFVKYSFKDDAKESARPQAQSISIQFWPGQSSYYVTWDYDTATNSYLRSNGGKPHLDNNTKKQLSAKNVVVLYMTQSHADDGYTNNEHLLFKTKGTGKALIFQDGKEITGTWKKSSRTGRTELFDASGKEISFVRGKIWFEVVPTGIGDVTVD